VGILERHSLAVEDSHMGDEVGHFSIQNINGDLQAPRLPKLLEVK
jgi:hypothetical protein